MSFLENMPTRNAANFSLMFSGEQTAGGTTDYIALNDTRPPEGQVIGMCQGHSVLGLNWHQQQQFHLAEKQLKQSVPQHVGGGGSNGNPWVASRSELAAVGPQPRNKGYVRGYGGGGGGGSMRVAHGAASGSPAARGSSSTVAGGGRHNDDDAHVPGNFVYSASRNKSRDKMPLGGGSGGVEGATCTHAVADAAAAPAYLDRRNTRRRAAAAASAAVDEATGVKVDGRESRGASVVTEGPENVNSLGHSVGGRGLLGVSQAGNWGGTTSVCSTTAARRRREVPLDREDGSCDAAGATTTRGRVGMRKARRTYGR